MSKDLNSSCNDLSWLASSTFLPSVLQMSSIPKPVDSHTYNNMEPWESLTSINQVRRNLSKNWISKASFSRDIDAGMSQNLPESANFPYSKDTCLKDTRIQNSLPDKSLNWSCFDSPFSSLSNDLGVKYSQNSFSSPSNSKDIWKNSYNLSDHCNLQSNPFSVNFEHMNSGTNSSMQNVFISENKPADRLSLPISPMSSLSPSTNSGTSPKLNTDLIALMQELAVITNDDDYSRIHTQNSTMTPFQTPPLTPSCTPTKGCVFCKNNSYHSTFYKSHSLKDNNGHCTCPVLRTYVCPLCGGTGDYAHTLKYCPRNTVTKGDPIAAGLPPGKVTNWREVATKMASQHKH